jgi:hypothetical protein
MGMPEKVVFVLSTGRTGTKTLAEGLAGDGILSPHQPPFSRFLTIASNYHLNGWLSRGAVEWLVTRVREPQILNADCRYYVQVFSLDYLPAKIISEKYPNVYIVHIVRDARAFVRSYLNWMQSRVKSLVANKVVVGWHPSGYFTGEMSWQQWRGMDAFERVCWHWTYKNGLLESLFAGGDRYLRVRFEDLFSEGGPKTLNQTLGFLGIPWEERFRTMLRRRRNVSCPKSCPPWESWSHGRKRRLADICGEKMSEYGYLDQNE